MEQEKDSEESSLFANTFDNPGADAPAPVEAGQPETEAPEQAPEEKGDPAPEAEVGQPRDEAGRFAPKSQDAEPAAPPAAEREPQHVPVAALKDERSKRQAIEDRLRQAEAFIAQMQQQQRQPPPAEQPPAQTPDPIGALLDNPQQFARQIAAEEIRQALAPIAEQQFSDRLTNSYARAKASAPDYDEADSLVAAALEAAPPQAAEQFRARLRSHPDPAQLVLSEGRRLRELHEFHQWKQSQAQAAQQPAARAPSAPSAPLPASLATARGVGASRQPDNQGGSLLDGIWRS